MRRPAYGRRMNRLPPVLVLITFATAAQAQTVNAPLTVEMGAPVPLAGAAPPDAALAGDRYLLSFSVRNRMADPLRLRRIAFRLPEGVELIAPDADGIDNDRDGSIDEGDEGFSRVEDATSAWRIEETVEPLSPGGSFERAVVVGIAETAQAGSRFDVDVIAAGSVAEATVRDERAAAFVLAPPVLTVTLDGKTQAGSYAADETPGLRAVATLPSGHMTGFGLTIKGSPAIDGYDDVRAVTGEGVLCDASEPPVREGRSLSADFGLCKVVRGSPEAERFVALEAGLRLRDAEPFAGAAVIEAHRAARLAGAMTQAGEMWGEPVTVSAVLDGPLTGARLLSVSDQPVDGGDAVRATFRIVNRGNNPARDARLIVDGDGVFACDSFVVDDDKKGADLCDGGFALGDMAAGTQRDVAVGASLRDDAMIEGELALRLSMSATDHSTIMFPPAVLNRRLPRPPVLSVAPTGEWQTTNDLMTARIGDSHTVVISGSLPEGRYPARINLLSRVVDAQTGDPISPAPLRVESFDAASRGEATFENDSPLLAAQTVDGWTVVSLPLGIVSVPVAKAANAPGFKGSAKLALRDLPEIEVGRLIEIAAVLELYGDVEVRSEDFAEIVIAEPALDLTVRSPDEDRTIDLHDTASVAVLTCNRGNSGAEALILTVRLPNGLLLDPSVPSVVRMIAAERADDIETLFSEAVEVVEPAGSPHFDAGENVLRGALSPDRTLGPDMCLALVFQVRRSDAFIPNTPTATITANVEPFTGRAGARARVYAGVSRGEIRFELPPVLFGPVSDRVLSTNGNIAHEVSLEIPEAAGEQRVDISAESSTGLDWTILRLAENGAALPWRDGTVLSGGEIVTFRLEAPGPDSAPLGWIDTTLVRALAFSEAGTPVAVDTRLITRRGEAPGGRIEVSKTMALDSDCDGNLDDERIQDALFEPVKDASPGDCVNFRIAFKHSGEKSMERIVVRDRVPEGTELRPDAVEILREPDGLHDTDIVTPLNSTRDVVWTFEGLFEPGAEGEVSYAVKLQEPE